MDSSAAGSRLTDRPGRGHAAWMWPPLLALAALQQTAAGLEQLEIALWPEYDRPAVLVIYRYQLPAEAALPAALALPVPANVSELHALAFVGPTGQLLNIDGYSLQTTGEWGTVVFSTPGRQGQLEFYTDLERSGDQRSFRFEWPGGVALESLGYEVQQPPTALGFSVIPQPDRQAVRQNGLTHHFGSLPPDARASIELSYTKADDRLSVDSLPAAQPPAALGQPSAPPAGGLDLRSAAPWALGALGVALLATGVIWYLRFRPEPSKAARRREARRERAEGAGAEIEASPIYCHNCGTRAGPSDIYCRQCGTKLRGR